MRNWALLRVNLAFIALAFVVMVLTSGCAVTIDHVDLRYDPQPGARKVQGAEEVKVKVEVSDFRDVKDKVSAKKNMYGMETAAIVSTRDVTQVVSEAFEAELQNRGFRIGSGDVLVFIELQKFYNDFKIGDWSRAAVAEVVMNVQVRKPNGEVLFSRSVRGKGTKQRCQLITGKNAKIALDGALRGAVLALVNDSSFINALLKPN